MNAAMLIMALLLAGLTMPAASEDFLCQEESAVSSGLGDTFWTPVWTPEPEPKEMPCLEGTPGCCYRSDCYEDCAQQFPCSEVGWNQGEEAMIGCIADRLACRQACNYCDY